MRWKQYYEHLINKLKINIDMSRYKDGDDDLVISELDQIIISNTNETELNELKQKIEESNKLIEDLNVIKNLNQFELEGRIRILQDSFDDEVRVSTSLKNEILQLNQNKIEYNELKKEFNSISENYNVLTSSIIEKELQVNKNTNKINSLEGTIIELNSTIDNYKLEISKQINEITNLKNLVQQFEIIKNNLAPHLENYQKLQIIYSELVKRNEILENKINTITNILGK